MALLLIAAPAWAVKPVTVSHTTQADFSSAEAKNAQVWSVGEVRLGGEAKSILPQRDEVAVVSAVAAGPTGEVYVGTGAKGVVLRVAADGAVAKLGELKCLLVSDLLLDGTRLLAAGAGGEAGVYSIDLTGPPGEAVKVTKLWSDPAVSAVWAMARMGDKLYAATAGEGKVYAIDSTGKGTVVFTAKQKVIRSIAAKGGKLYAGAGDEGLVYEVDPQKKSSRVLLDAAEKEIVALAVGPDGAVYAAATNVSTAMPTPPVATESGRSASGPATGEAGSRPTSASSETSPAPTPAIRPVAPARGSAREANSIVAPPSAPARGRASSAPSGGGPGSSSPGNPAAASRPTTSGSTPGTSGGAAPTAETMPVRPTVPAAMPPRPIGAPIPAGSPGNAVYRIDTEGFVKVVFRQPQTILGMALTGGRLVLATGGSGLIYLVDLSDGSWATIATLDPKQVTAIAVAADATIVAGTTSPAIAVKIAPRLAGEGTLTSKPIDAKQIARWGQVRVEVALPDGTSATLATRSGNLEEAADDTWSSWSAEIQARLAPQGQVWSAIGSPAGRFIQYRLTLKPSGPAAGGSVKGPTVTGIHLTYQVGNLAPELESVTATPAERPQPGPSGPPGAPPGPKRYRLITFKSSDPNSDNLKVNVLYRKVGTEVWIMAKEDLPQPMYPWDTLSVPDGEYEVKVEVSDVPDNTPDTALSAARIARPVLVDNTAPALAELTAKEAGKGSVRLAVQARDALSRVERVEYVVDSAENYTPLAADDGMFDSLAERAGGVVKDLKPGPHVITVRAMDENGNAGYASVSVTVAAN